MLPSYSCFALNQLHALVCLNNRVTCVRLNEHMHVFQGFVQKPNNSFYVLNAKRSLLRVFPQLSKSIERANGRFWGEKGGATARRCGGRRK